MLANASCHTLSQSHLLRKLESKETNNHLLSFCNNDYFNLATHPKVISALQKGANLYGLGSGGSAQISGYTQAHQAFEERMAAFLKRDKAILFNSGYHANIGVMTTFANRHSHVVLDKYSHASIVDGTLLSRSKYHRFKHNDIAHAKSLLKDHSLLVSESVFSIVGDVADVNALSQIAQEKKAMLIIDDAHGFGVLGKEGRGITESTNLNQESLPCLITPLGKGLGSMGAIVSGHKEMIDALLQNARTHRYSTALPPAIAYASEVALSLLEEEAFRRKHLQALINFFIIGAKFRALPLLSDHATPIKSILTIDNKRTLSIQARLKKHGVLVAAIRPPTVPTQQACIRVSLNYSHTFNDVTLLLDLLKDATNDDTQ